MSNTTTITVNTKEFASAFSKSAKGTNAKAAISSLHNVFLSTEGNYLAIRSSSLDTWYSAKIKALSINGNAESVFNLSVKPDAITKALKFLGKAETELVFTSDNDEVTEMEIISGTKHIKTICRSDDYPISPVIEDGKMFTLNMNDIADRYSHIAYAVGSVAVRPFLSGIHFNGGDMVASDSYRLAISRNGEHVPSRFTIPATALKYISECLDGKVAVVTMNHKYICFSTENECICSKLLAGDYLDCSRILEQNKPHSCDVPRKKMMDALKYLKLFVDDVKQSPIRYENDVLSVKTAEGVFSEQIGIHSPLDTAFGFDVKYMLDVLTQFGTNDVLHISVVSSLSPIIISACGDDRNFALLCPMRLKD